MKARKAFYNIISQTLYEIVALICALILPRLILTFYGSNYNGMISSITQFLDYISILTLGISGSTRVAIYRANAKNDIREVSAILKATERYMRKVAYALIAYVVVLMVVYPCIVHDDFTWFESASLVAIIAIGTFAEYFFGITYKTFLTANQSMYIYNIIQIAVKIGSTAVSTALIVSGASIQIVMLGSAVCMVLSRILLNFIVTRKYGILKSVAPDEAALKQRKDVMAHSIANCVHDYTDIFLLTLFTSPGVVSVYSVYTLVLNGLNKMQNVFTTGLEGAFGDLWAKGEYRKYEENLNTFEFLMFAFVSIVFSCTAILLLPFVRLYTKNVTDIEYIVPSFAFLSVACYATLCMRMPYIIGIQAAGHYKETKKYAFIEAGLNLGISFVGIFRFGLIGVTAGTLVANIYRTWKYARYLSKNLLKRSMLGTIKKNLWCCSNLIIIFVVKEILPDLTIISWISWVFNGIYYFAIASAITGIMSLVFYRNELKKSLYVMKKMLQRKNKRRIYDESK